jgi:thiamine biosynthesis protein ThiS
MRVSVNGQPQSLADGASVASLLEAFDLAPQRVAVEVNMDLVRRADFADTELREGDRIEIVTLVGGG